MELGFKLFCGICCKEINIADLISLDNEEEVLIAQYVCTCGTYTTVNFEK